MSKEQQDQLLGERVDEFIALWQILLAKALSFNCPHCNNPCVLYREGDQY